MKLSALTYIIIGFSIFLIAVTFGLFRLYVPNTTEAGYWREYKAELDAEIAKKSAAERRVKLAKEMVDEQTRHWKDIVATRTPPLGVNSGGIDVGVNAWQLTVDSVKFRDSIQRAVNAQVHAGGVKLVSNGPLVPRPSQNGGDILATFYNYPAIPFPVVMFDFGAITVQGTYRQICDNVRAYTHMPHYLAVTDGLNIQGTGPILQGTYQLSIVGFIRGNSVFPPVDGASLASATAPGLGAPGGNGIPPRGGGGRGNRPDGRPTAPSGKAGRGASGAGNGGAD